MDVTLSFSRLRGGVRVSITCVNLLTPLAGVSLTQVDEAHDGVGLAHHGAQRRRVCAEGGGRRVADLSQPLSRSDPPNAGPVHHDLVALVLPVRRHGVVQVQHEERR